ncbi:PREDICTED: uncharacterized protein LOC104779082 [Camelina sativa]|uniref:Uncharacterized protein LOC104779082 n=1 Tax=Camelina sativa TaxID=90675 RepID=A0ABM0YJ69_CAMSA|nr:PREDICTED: uncharacterized protein LOC104779082 [Camelina sativa]
MIHRDHLEQFSRLRDYKDAILTTNPNSTVELDTIIGQLLAAVGRDTNNGLYHIAWAVVDVEDEENFISDRQNGLLNAVDKVLPHIEHRMYARNIYGNLKKRNPEKCSLAFCSPTAKCVDVHNNISESFNNIIDPARYIPMVEMLETIRRRTMVHIDLRKTVASQYTGRITERAKEILEEEEAKNIKYCSFVPGGEGRFDVRECGVSYSVNLRLRTCVCRRWEMSGIPCRHALRVIIEKKLNREDYIIDWYLNSRQQCIYSDSIAPINGILFWHRSGYVVVPPAALVEQIENRKCKKPKLKRKKARHESPTKKKKNLSRENRIMHCSLCDYPVHNNLKCPNVGVERYKPPSKTPRKKKQPSIATQGTQGNQASEGSQATQTTHATQD